MTILWEIAFSWCFNLHHGRKDTRTQGHKDTRTQGRKDTRTQEHKDTRTHLIRVVQRIKNEETIHSRQNCNFDEEKNIV